MLQYKYKTVHNQPCFGQKTVKMFTSLHACNEKIKVHWILINFVPLRLLMIENRTYETKTTMYCHNKPYIYCVHGLYDKMLLGF